MAYVQRIEEIDGELARLQREWETETRDPARRRITAAMVVLQRHKRWLWKRSQCNTGTTRPAPPTRALSASSDAMLSNRHVRSTRPHLCNVIVCDRPAIQIRTAQPEDAGQRTGDPRLAHGGNDPGEVALGLWSLVDNLLVPALVERFLRELTVGR